MAEFSLGTLQVNATPVGKAESIGGSDLLDTYSFQLASDSNVNIALTGKTADAELLLFRDFNGDGQINGNDRVIAGNVRRNGDNSIDLSSETSFIEAGASYIVGVKPVNGVSTPYNLKVSATAQNQASNLLPADGTLGKFSLIEGGVRLGDTTDTYRFSVASSGNFLQLNLRGDADATGDANVRVIRDADNDRVVDPGEVLASSTLRGTSNESIKQNLLVGGDNYYVQVFASGIGGNYTLETTLS